MSKNTRILAAAMLGVALAPSAIWAQEVCPGSAKATTCTIDNFTSGYGLVKPITSGSETVNQPATGSGSGIVGGTRSITLTSSSGIGTFGQPTQVQTVRQSSTNQTPAALVWSNGYANLALLDVVYGDTNDGVAPLDLDLTQYNTDSNGRIRFTFAGSQGISSFAVEPYYTGGYGACTFPIPQTLGTFTVDFPFSNFAGDVDWGDVTAILFQFEAGVVTSPNLAVTDIEVIAATSSTPPATYTCGAE
jgi:hypothetical protein